MLASIWLGLKRPSNKVEQCFIFLTGSALFLDGLSTYLLYEADRKGVLYLREFNPAVASMHKNVFFGIMLYNISWISVVLFFRFIKEVEYTIMISHIISNGLAALDNFFIMLFETAYISDFLCHLNIKIEHIIIIVVLIYYLIYVIKKDEGISVRKLFVIFIGVISSIAAEFIIILTWYFYLIKFF